MIVAATRRKLGNLRKTGLHVFRTERFSFSLDPAGVGAHLREVRFPCVPALPVAVRRLRSWQA
jgi:hypothetical protein